MNFIFQKLTQAHAIEIANNWKYDGENAFYDMTSDLEDYEEFTNMTLRNENDYFEVIKNNELVGFFCVMQEETVIEIGLGLSTHLCGRGIGKSFLNQIMAFINEKYDFKKYQLAVATFNQRAIKVYRALGFKDEEVYMQTTNGGQYEFLRMVKYR